MSSFWLNVTSSSMSVLDCWQGLGDVMSQSAKDHGREERKRERKGNRGKVNGQR